MVPGNGVLFVKAAQPEQSDREDRYEKRKENHQPPLSEPLYRARRDPADSLRNGFTFQAAVITGKTRFLPIAEAVLIRRCTYTRVQERHSSQYIMG